MHHRFPTSTINVKRAAHPFTTKDYFGDTQYILVHNGHITNSDKLFEKHQELGIQYQSWLQDNSFNDSEALLWDFALTMEGKQSGLSSYGGIAFICIKTVKGKLEKMYFGRNFNPLILKRDALGISLSSEGDGEPIDSQTLYTWNYTLRRLTKRDMNIPSMAPYRSSPLIPYTWDWEDERPVDYSYSRKKVIDADDPALMGDNEADKLLKDLGLSITQEDIERCVSTYLGGTLGVYESAYWNMEGDYAVLEEQKYSRANFREMILLLRAIETLGRDPHYEDKSSVSPAWAEGKTW